MKDVSLWVIDYSTNSVFQFTDLSTEFLDNIELCEERLTDLGFNLNNINWMVGENTLFFKEKMYKPF